MRSSRSLMTIGFALYYPSCSTVIGRPGLTWRTCTSATWRTWTSAPEHLGAGLGFALLAQLARLAVERGGGRLGWWVLRANDHALRFFRRRHDRGLDEIEVMRLGGESCRLLQPVPPQHRSACRRLADDPLARTPRGSPRDSPDVLSSRSPVD
ncbi:GNAT family N-acetyltransferase [Blastococcus jejuensis]|uniref:GNAT family N-acetyltransferase n=1 Tax=Blastococcus jejuensis TaxID=351224 RepID=UPI003CD098DC